MTPKEKEWEFKKTREQLIKMVKTAIKNHWQEHMAMDIVDAILVPAWDYIDKDRKKEKEKALKEQAKDIFGEMEKIGSPNQQCKLCDETYEDCDCYDKLKQKYLESFGEVRNNGNG